MTPGEVDNTGELMLWGILRPRDFHAIAICFKLDLLAVVC